MSAPRPGSRRRAEIIGSVAAAIGVLAATGAALQMIGTCAQADPEPPLPEAEELLEPAEPKVVPITIDRRKPVRVAVEEPKASAPPAPKPVVPAPPAPLEATTFKPSASDFLKGQRLLEGGFPRLIASYERIGFPTYRDAALALGGAFFLWDGESNQPVARLDPITGEAWDGPLTSHLSRWPRKVSGHLDSAIARHRDQYGGRATHAVLLPPSRLDAALLSGLDRLLRRNGVDPSSVASFYGAYELRGGHLFCVVLEATLKDSTKREVSFAINLSGAGA